MQDPSAGGSRWPRGSLQAHRGREGVGWLDSGAQAGHSDSSNIRLCRYRACRPGDGQPGLRRPGGAAADNRQGEPAMKWNLRWAAAKRDIWRPADLLKAFEEVEFAPSLSKVAALCSGKPISVRLDDLDTICAALGCPLADLLEAEPLAAAGGGQEHGKRPVVPGDGAGPP